MNRRIQVKTRFLAALALVVANATFPLNAAEPSAQEILDTVRVAQSKQHRKLKGVLQNGPQNTPFRLILQGPTIRYEFTNPDQALVVELGEESTELKDVTPKKSEKVTARRYDDKVRGTDITYEDISLRFLYWKNAKVIGRETVKSRSCYKLELHPQRNEASQYGTVFAWVDQAGGLLKAECYGRDGRLAMRFTLVSIQGSRIEDGIWLPKKMSIQRMEGTKPKDPQPTYMEISEE